MPLELLVECRACDGRGAHYPGMERTGESYEADPCRTCDGTGRVLETVRSGHRDIFCLSCDRCNGTGSLCDGHVLCGQCEGSSYYYRLSDGRLAVDPEVAP